MREKYAEIMDDIQESCSRLALKFNVPSEQILLLGDFNAHLEHKSCGLVDDPDEGNVGGVRGARMYTEQRFSQCQGNTCIARGNALDRACARHAWLVLNGRCKSDPSGAFTNTHLGRNTVLDLAIVPRVAVADMTVIQVKEAQSVHRAVWAVVAPATARSQLQQAEVEAARLRPASVKLTSMQLSQFQESEWSALHNSLVSCMADGDYSLERAEQVLDIFETAIQTKLAGLTGQPVGVTSVRGQERPAHATKEKAAKQLWFNDECIAAKARWKGLQRAAADEAAINAAKTTYRRTCRRARSEFLWHVESFRARHEKEFWALLKIRPPAPLPTLPTFLAHFEKLFGGGEAGELPPELASIFADASITPFQASEVRKALDAMRHGKSAGNAVYTVDLLRNMEQPDFYHMIADIFTYFARAGYPSKLNTLLLMPLYKFKGDRESCDNYRGISLIHPLGRWFSKCLVNRLEAHPNLTRARCQAGFRAGYRVEDNCVVLSTMYELARAHKSPLHTVFIDLRKAYDCVDRNRLYRALVAELGVDAGLVSILHKMYTGVRAQVVLDGALSDSFGVEQGVLQGCPASPLVFSAFMDRLERFLDSRMADWSRAERTQVRTAGMLIPLLLFADDIVVAGRTLGVVQRLLDDLATFCDDSGLTVNLSKTKWMIGGTIPRAAPNELPRYKGDVVAQVESFKYLGLQFTGTQSLQAMLDARYKAANASWGKLMGVMTSQGWRDRATRIILFGTYVKTCLLYGGPVWGMEFLPRSGNLKQDCMGKFGVFYRRCLRSLLGVSGMLRNEIVYILSGQFPLRLYLAKMVVRFQASMQGSDRLVAQIGEWVHKLDNRALVCNLTLDRMHSFCEVQDSVQRVYDSVCQAIATALRSADRLMGRPMLQVWIELVKVSLVRTREPLEFPADIYTNTQRRRQRLPHFRTAYYPRKGICPVRRATWLQLSDRDLHRLIGYMYERTGDVPAATEARYLATLADKGFEGWSPVQSAVADMVWRNGLAICVWCDATTVLSMMDQLWGTL